MTDLHVLPYRPCAGIMLLNAQGLVWVGRRIPDNPSSHVDMYWQMPQGGIDPGESPQQAALRELHEETGVYTVEILAEIPDWLVYDLPTELLGVALKGKYRGQRQKWFAMQLKGSEAEINITPDGGEKPEFDAWKWVPHTELADLTVPFKRNIYREVLEAFGDVL